MAERIRADVPHEIFLASSDAESHCWGHPEHGLRYADSCRRAGLAAAIPLIEQQARERVLAEVDQEHAHETWMAGNEEDPALCCCQQGLMCPDCNAGRHSKCPDWLGERDEDDEDDDRG